jgi:hypothetical protein
MIGRFDDFGDLMIFGEFDDFGQIWMILDRFG